MRRLRIGRATPWTGTGGSSGAPARAMSRQMIPDGGPVTAGVTPLRARRLLRLRFRRPRETLKDFDQALVRRATRVAKLGHLVRVRESVQAQQLAGALASVQLQLGRPVSEQQPSHFG